MFLFYDFCYKAAPIPPWPSFIIEVWSLILLPFVFFLLSLYVIKNLLPDYSFRSCYRFPTLCYTKTGKKTITELKKTSTDHKKIMTECKETSTERKETSTERMQIILKHKQIKTK